MATSAYAPTLERWLQRLANAGRSSRTLAAYRADLDDTMATVAAVHGIIPPRPQLARLAPDERERVLLEAFDRLELSTVSFDDLDEAIAEFRTRPDPRYRVNPQRGPAERAPATVARRTAAIRTFFAWCYSTGRIPADPAAKLEAPKRRKRLPRALTEAVAGQALDQSGAGARWPERDQLIIALALACGLRLEEISTLRLDQLVGTRPDAIVVRGKGDKERRLGVPPVVQEALAAYLPTRAARLAKLGLDARTVIVSSRPRAVRDREGEVVALTVESSRESVAYVVDRLLRHLGARQAQIRVHALRHTFATLGLREGAFSLRQLQVALGHSSLATTQIYTEVADEELAAAMQLHPLSGGPRSGARR
ncbi:MAG: tyrosine-type recombinase/integrase [Actinobacteria bacterium]|nr:tyrosine-type recombinase/integrase [Actinomycetota bacterium]MBW3650487.1 tyrosine-type recombinase/integrase [Actinomycetota bacterium]